MIKAKPIENNGKLEVTNAGKTDVTVKGLKIYGTAAGAGMPITVLWKLHPSNLVVTDISEKLVKIVGPTNPGANVLIDLDLEPVPEDQPAAAKYLVTTLDGKVIQFIAA